MSKAVYECPRCEKALVVEEEPPGMIHKCDDCVERMVPVDDERNGCSSNTGTDQNKSMEGSQ